MQFQSAGFTLVWRGVLEMLGLSVGSFFCIWVVEEWGRLRERGGKKQIHLGIMSCFYCWISVCYVISPVGFPGLWSFDGDWELESGWGARRLETDCVRVNQDGGECQAIHCVFPILFLRCYTEHIHFGDRHFITLIKMFITFISFLLETECIWTRWFIFLLKAESI